MMRAGVFATLVGFAASWNWPWASTAPASDEARPVPANFEAAPRSKQEMEALIQRHLLKNESLQRYFLTPKDQIINNVQRNWQPMSEQCTFSKHCYCFHVRGSLDKIDNPRGAEACEIITKDATTKSKHPRIGKCTKDKKALACEETCIVGHGKPCLFSNMAPAKVLAVIATARAAGVTHIIEEGRLGGITAFMYSLHGFDVTSIEYLPLDEVTDALGRMAPKIKLVNGDGAVLVPQVVAALPENTRALVIFDGEKRLPAYQTFKKVKDRVVFAVFDDTHSADWASLVREFDAHEIWWHTLGDRVFELLRKGHDAFYQSWAGNADLNPSGARARYLRIGDTPFAFVKGGLW